MKIARPFSLGTSPRIQSSSDMRSHSWALGDFHGALTPACLAGASSLAAARIACCTSGSSGSPGTAGYSERVPPSMSTLEPVS